MSEFFHMGGYARFVWPSYALTLLIVVLNVVSAWRALSRARAEARRRASTLGATL